MSTKSKHPQLKLFQFEVLSFFIKPMEAAGIMQFTILQMILLIALFTQQQLHCLLLITEKLLREQVVLGSE